MNRMEDPWESQQMQCISCCQQGLLLYGCGRLLQAVIGAAAAATHFAEIFSID
jgi:hypothetical protein